jgi:LTXXQ motif family protein
MNKRELIALFGSALISERALAQFGGRRGRGGMPGGDGQGKAGRQEPTPVLEVTLHELEEDLKLVPEQQPLFDAYAEALRGLGNDVARERQRQSAAKAASGSLAERIDHNVDTLRNRLTAVEDIAQAAKALYAKLNPDQQRAADPRLATLMLLPLSQEGPMKPPSMQKKS